MAIRIAIDHKTHYEFDRPVSLAPHTIRLRPAPHSRTKIHSYSLKVSPKGYFINWQQDAFGNYLARLVFPEKVKELHVEVEVIADMTVINPFDFFVEDYAEHFPFEYTKQLKKELAPYLEKLPGGKKFDAFLAAIPKEKQQVNDFLVMLNQRLEKAIDYSLRFDPGVQTPEETLELGVGSCRDTAWLLVQLLRHMGLAARFASGYLVQLTSDEKSLDGPSGPEADFTDLHAWCEVYVPGAGWIGMDPTSGLFASEGHIPLACTPDPSSAAPIEGATDKCEVEFTYTNEVTRVHEDPRVTKPYSDSEWADILSLGDYVDRQLLKDDVRLTMGGEPTFVSIDDMESAQWNTEALGADKLALAKTLLLKLRDHFAPHGMLHYGQGKWYPGEELPRWALGLFWRTDNKPLWRNPKLLARVDKNYGFTADDAQVFIERLTEKLQLSAEYIHSAYEDLLHYLSEEQKLPMHMDLKKELRGKNLDRKRVLKLLEKGLDKTTGYVLPLAWNDWNQSWRSDRWEFRRQELVLHPGDSPMGLRLPIGELQAEYEHFIHADQFADKPELQEAEALVAQLRSAMAPATAAAVPAKQTVSEQKIAESVAADAEAETEDDSDTAVKTEKKLTRKIISPANIITALCIEPRDGKLHIFMPPLTDLESYLHLLAAIELTAEELEKPVILEGYEPPRDHRLQKLLVTPDPGVIEVNVHPTTNWRELVENTTALYEVARQSRLGTEKFMLDGRHTGTGGGNHITLGGATPADSPMLRRPELLRSLITYWQHHPSLSYLFSGTFIGPTSQAPRVDEGRDEMLYELEVAFQQMPQGDCQQPWLIDRILRNLLIDVTGNTHRAEFCIDKLYAPGSASGRLGILEFRGFEMPPHARMSLVQALLIRALVTKFWRQPYRQPLVRWGTSLHDKFMLPHFIWEDVKEIVRDLQDADIDFKAEWLLPFEEFRFPHYGRTKLDSIEIELRWAIEPWNVLGEEVGSFGTARYVDSSVERLQVKVYGLTDSRYVLACNGRRVPLTSTPRQGEYVAGVRYRAWAPPSALHPTIGVHTPLVFDLIDTWNGRSVGGCTYHVSHPGGRSYDVFPVNAPTAESRRVSRFETIGHTPGPFTPRPDIDALREFFPRETPRPMAPPPEESPGEYPFTLDLRRQASFIGK